MLCDSIPANTEALGDLFDFYVEAPPVVGGGMEKARSLLPRMREGTTRWALAWQVANR